MLIVREHQRDGEDGTNVDAVICKSGPVDRSKFNGDGGGWGGVYMGFPKSVLTHGLVEEALISAAK